MNMQDFSFDLKSLLLVLFGDVTNIFMLKVILASICGFLFGVERQKRDKPFGVRTCILVCVGTAFFISIGKSLTGGVADPTRVLGQVITGIGFLGGGVIFSQNGNIKGITSASVVWMLAAVGAAIGLEHFGKAIFTTVFGLAILIFSDKLENFFTRY